jgi:hypothetical protein
MAEQKRQAGLKTESRARIESLRNSATLSPHLIGGKMVKKTVEFDARKKVKVPVKVKFRTSSGEPVSFPAHKPVKKKVHVKFTAKSSK